MSKREEKVLKSKAVTRRYRPVFWVSAEGCTERDYFKMNVFRDLNVSVKFPKNIHPSRRNPEAVLKRFQKMLRENNFRKDDEAWLVIDTDDWDENEFAEVLKWEQEDSRHHLAISNPKFELFLIMHFESGNSCTTPVATDAALKRHIPNYNKHIKVAQFSSEEVKAAVVKAKTKRASCNNVFPKPGMTDVYRLVESLFKWES